MGAPYPPLQWPGPSRCFGTCPQVGLLPALPTSPSPRTWTPWSRRGGTPSHAASGWPEAQLPPPWAQRDSTDSLLSLGAPDLCISRAPSRKPRPWPKKGQIIGTGGRISVDRSSKATLPLTIPRPIFKSSAKDSSPRSSEIECKAPTPGCSAGAGELSTHASGGACAPLLVVG